MLAEKTKSKRREGSPFQQSLHLYLKEICHIQLLTPEEERELGYRIQAGDEVAVRKLVECNLRFVVKIAKKYRRLGISFLDLISEGNLGLMEAAKRFDPDKNVKFISYAIWWIRQSILAALSTLGHPLRLPSKVNNTLYRVGVTTAKQVSELQRKPTFKEVADDVGISQSELYYILQVGGEAISLSQPVTDKNEKVLEDVLLQTSGSSVEEGLVRDAVKKQLNDSLKDLGKNEEIVLRLRFGLDNDRPHTLSEIGRIIGLSRERVRQIQVRALKKLRENSRTQPLHRTDVAA